MLGLRKSWPLVVRLLLVLPTALAKLSFSREPILAWGGNFHRFGEHIYLN